MILFLAFYVAYPPAFPRITSLPVDSICQFIWVCYTPNLPPPLPRSPSSLSLQLIQPNVSSEWSFNYFLWHPYDPMCYLRSVFVTTFLYPLNTYLRKPHMITHM